MRNIYLVILLMFSLLGNAQDIHWSHSQETRSLINPAENGNDSLLKSTLIYRNQWSSLISAYKTTGINVNAPLFKGIGVGISYYNDRAGTAGWQQNNAMLNISYTHAIKKIKLSYGIGLGMDQKSIDKTKMLFPDQINSDLTILPTSQLINQESSSSFDNSLGIQISYPLNKILVEISANATHLAANNIYLLGSPDGTYGTLFNIYAHGKLPINTQWDVDPYITLQNQLQFNELLLGSRFNYNSKDIVFYGGLGYRMRDALIAQVGFRKKGISAGISYDYTISTLRENAANSSSFEVLIGYNLLLAKKRKDPKIEEKPQAKKDTIKTIDNLNFQALVKDARTGKGLSDYSFAIFPKDKTFSSASDSMIRDTMKLGENYIVSIKKENYFPYSDTLWSISSDIQKIYLLEPIELNKEYSLNNIYYDFNESTLTPQSKIELNKLAVFLSDNKKLVVELSSHTDNKGEPDYNLKLSQERANSCVNYLIAKGINPSKLVPKGYGESKPKASNTNIDGSDSPEGRSQNRRTEFKILDLGLD